MKHLSSLQLCAFLDAVLVGAPDDGTARHLATCTICRARYETWCHVDDSLRELLGQDPEEHAMEQRMSWVQIVVTAERKGLPAPEFAVLRIALPPQLPAPPPVQVFPPGRAPGFADPAPRTTTPEPLKRPMLHSPILESQALAQRASASSAPTPAAPRAARQPAQPPVAAGANPSAPPPGYARMPRPPRKGFAAFVSRPGMWIALALVAVLAGAVPLGVARFGIPVIKFGFKSGHERDADVKPAGDEKSDGADDAEPARKGSAKARKGAPDDPGTQPDASVLFDLPALEPEDGEPDPGATDAAPTRPGKPADRDTPARSGPTLCGEVHNPQGQPVEGARVYLTSPPRMVRTDKSGRFCISCPQGKRTIRIEATGRAPVTRTVQMGSTKLETRFTLVPVN